MLSTLSVMQHNTGHRIAKVKLSGISGGTRIMLIESEKIIDAIDKRILITQNFKLSEVEITALESGKQMVLTRLWMFKDNSERKVVSAIGVVAN